jgi:hypothetical protein
LERSYNQGLHPTFLEQQPVATGVRQYTPFETQYNRGVAPMQMQQSPRGSTGAAATPRAGPRQFDPLEAQYNAMFRENVGLGASAANPMNPRASIPPSAHPSMMSSPSTLSSSSDRQEMQRTANGRAYSDAEAAYNQRPM